MLSNSLYIYPSNELSGLLPPLLCHLSEISLTESQVLVESLSSYSFYFNGNARKESMCIKFGKSGWVRYINHRIDWSAFGMFWNGTLLKHLVIYNRSGVAYVHGNNYSSRVWRASIGLLGCFSTILMAAGGNEILLFKPSRVIASVIVMKGEPWQL